MKQFKAITVNGEMALKRLPEMDEAAWISSKIAWEKYIGNYQQYLSEIESEPIIKVAPEYKDFWKEGDLVNQNEFTTKNVCNTPYCHCGNYPNPYCRFNTYGKPIAIPKPKEDEGETLAFGDLLEMSNLLPPEQFMHYAKQHYSITKKTTTP